MIAVKLIRRLNLARRKGNAEDIATCEAALRDVEEKNRASALQRNLSRIVENRRREGRAETKTLEELRLLEQRAYIRQLIEDSKRYGYKRGWAFHEYRRKYGKFPPRCWMRIDEKERR